MGTSEFVFDANLDDFDEVVVKPSAEKVMLVDFWAEWCAPCHGLAPHLIKAVEEQEGRVVLAKVEVDEGENMKLAGRYKLRGFPTVLLFIDGQEKARFAGARATHWIRDWLHEHAAAQLA